MHSDHLVIRTAQGRLVLGRSANFPPAVRRAAEHDGMHHALEVLRREHGAIDQLRRWPGRHDLHLDTRSANDNDLLRIVERGIAAHRLLLVEIVDRPVLLKPPPPPEQRPILKPPPGLTLTAQQQADATVAAMGMTDKVIAGLKRSAGHMGPALADTFKKLFTAESLEVMAAFVIAGALANTNPISGAVFDSAMLIMVYYQAGSAGLDALEVLVRTTLAAINAKSVAELDRAGENYARAFVGLGGAVFMAWLARRIVKEEGPGARTAEPASAPPPEPVAPTGPRPLDVKPLGPDGKPLTGTALARKLGAEGEEAVGVTGPKTAIRIPGSNQLRIPDKLTDTVLTEVKNVKELRYTQQLRDFANYSEQTGRSFELWVRPSTVLNDEILMAQARGELLIKYIPGAP